MAVQNVRYLVFDIESVADGELIAKLHYPNDKLEPAEAIERLRRERLEKYDNDFIPYTYQIPVSVVVAKVRADFRLLDLVCLDEPEYRPHEITRNFWRGWEHYERPTLVSFNGRSFDMPLMELAAFRYGWGVFAWFDQNQKSFEQCRNRYNTKSHLDLHDMLTNFGASRFSGGLNLAANLLGKPGKMEVQGHMVQGLYDEGKLAAINDYCRCDVLDTYFVFLRWAVLSGQMDLEVEQEIVVETKQWLSDRAADIPVLQTYLSRWGDWQNPWTEAATPAEATKATESPDAEVPQEEQDRITENWR